MIQLLIVILPFGQVKWQDNLEVTIQRPLEPLRSVR